MSYKSVCRNEQAKTQPIHYPDLQACFETFSNTERIVLYSEIIAILKPVKSIVVINCLGARNPIRALP